MAIVGAFLCWLTTPQFAFLRDTQMLIAWAVSSSFLIAAILVLLRLFKGKGSCRLEYAMWTVVLVRLLLPIQILDFGLVREIPQSWTEKNIPVFPYARADFEDADPHYAHLEPGWLGPTYGSAFYVERSEDGDTLTYYVDIFSGEQVAQSVWWTGVLVAGGTMLARKLRLILQEERCVPENGTGDRAKRVDPWKLLWALALALHWYNPLVWLAVVQARKIT